MLPLDATVLGALKLGPSRADTHWVMRIICILHHSRAMRAAPIALAAALLVPCTALAQARSSSASVAVSAAVMPACRLQHGTGLLVSRMDDSTTQVVVRVRATSNAHYRVVATTLGRADGDRARGADAGWRVLVRNPTGAFIALEPGEPLAIATGSDPGIREHDVAYQVIDREAGGAGARAEPRVGVACVVEEAGVATGVVLEL
jgi:hypothetical protein